MPSSLSAEAALCLVRGLQNVDVFAGEVAVFSCEVSRAGGPDARWWLDGTLLQDGPLSVVAVHDGTQHSLTLSGLGVADSGTVTFRAGPLVSMAKLLVKGIGHWGCPMLKPSCTRIALHAFQDGHSFWAYTGVAGCPGSALSHVGDCPMPSFPANLWWVGAFLGPGPCHALHYGLGQELCRQEVGRRHLFFPFSQL